MIEKIPVSEIIAKCDELFNAGRGAENGEYLVSWQRKAQKAGDFSGELSVVNELIGFYRMNKMAVPGITAVSRAQELILKTSISGTVSCGTILLNCASAMHSFGKVDEAKELFDLSYECYAKNLPPDDLLFAGLLNNMSSIYAEKGDFYSACACCKEAGDILQKEHKIMDLAVSLVNLAQIHLQFEPDSPELPGIFDRAMACFDSADVPLDGYYAHTCTKCAGVFGAAGRIDDEKELLRRAEVIYECH